MDWTAEALASVLTKLSRDAVHDSCFRSLVQASSGRAPPTLRDLNDRELIAIVTHPVVWASSGLPRDGCSVLLEYKHSGIAHAGLHDPHLMFQWGGLSNVYKMKRRTELVQTQLDALVEALPACDDPVYNEAIAKFVGISRDIWSIIRGAREPGEALLVPEEPSEPAHQGDDPVDSLVRALSSFTQGSLSASMAVIQACRILSFQAHELLDPVSHVMVREGEQETSGVSSILCEEAAASLLYVLEHHAAFLPAQEMEAVLNAAVLFMKVNPYVASLVPSSLLELLLNLASDLAERYRATTWSSSNVGEAVHQTKTAPVLDVPCLPWLTEHCSLFAPSSRRKLSTCLSAVLRCISAVYGCSESKSIAGVVPGASSLVTVDSRLPQFVADLYVLVVDGLDQGLGSAVVNLARSAAAMDPSFAARLAIPEKDGRGAGGGTSGGGVGETSSAGKGTMKMPPCPLKRIIDHLVTIVEMDVRLASEDAAVDAPMVSIPSDGRLSSISPRTFSRWRSELAACIARETFSSLVNILVGSGSASTFNHGQAAVLSYLRKEASLLLELLSGAFLFSSEGVRHGKTDDRLALSSNVSGGDDGIEGIPGRAGLQCLSPSSVDSPSRQPDSSTFTHFFERHDAFGCPVRQLLTLDVLVSLRPTGNIGSWRPGKVTFELQLATTLSLHRTGESTSVLDVCTPHLLHQALERVIRLFDEACARVRGDGGTKKPSLPVGVATKERKLTSKEKVGDILNFVDQQQVFSRRSLYHAHFTNQKHVAGTPFIVLLDIPADIFLDDAPYKVLFRPFNDPHTSPALHHSRLVDRVLGRAGAGQRVRTSNPPQEINVPLAVQTFWDAVDHLTPGRDARSGGGQAPGSAAAGIHRGPPGVSLSGPRGDLTALLGTAILGLRFEDLRHVTRHA